MVYSVTLIMSDLVEKRCSLFWLHNWETEICVSYIDNMEKKHFFLITNKFTKFVRLRLVNLPSLGHVFFFFFFFHVLSLGLQFAKPMVYVLL